MEFINKILFEGLSPENIISSLSIVFFSTRMIIFSYYALENSSYVLNYYANGSGTEDLNPYLDEHTASIYEIESYPIAEHILANLPLIDRGIAVDRLDNRENWGFVPVFSFDLVRTILGIEDGELIRSSRYISPIFSSEIPLPFFNLIAIFCKFMQLGSLFQLTGLEVIQILLDMASNNLDDIIIDPEYLILFDISLFDIAVAGAHIENLYWLLSSINLESDTREYIDLYRNLHPFLYHLYLLVLGIDYESSYYICTYDTVTFVSDLLPKT